MFNIIQKVHHDIFVVKMVFHGDFQGMYIYIYICTHLLRELSTSLKGQLGVPLTVYPGYLLCSLGILGDNLPINTHMI